MSLTVREIEANAGPVAILKRAREIVAFRELLISLTRKDLKVRYKNSSLGFLWSMISPLFYLVVYYIVFNVFIPAGIPRFHVYLLAGLLPWTLFGNSLNQATGSVVANAGLLKKVHFPREMLPFSSIGAGLFHFVVQMLVFALFLVATSSPFSGVASLLIIPALIAELLLLAGLGLFFSAINVKARDVQYLLELGLLAWFFMTPIVYPSALIVDRLGGHSLLGIPYVSIYLANPMTRIVLAFQRAIFGAPTQVIDSQTYSILIDASLSWYLKGVGYAALAGIVFIALGWWVFHRLDGDFAEEL